MPNIVILHPTTDSTTAIEYELHKVRPRNQTKDKALYHATMKPIPHEDLEQFFVVGRQASRPVSIYTFVQASQSWLSTFLLIVRDCSGPHFRIDKSQIFHDRSEASTALIEHLYHKRLLGTSLPLLLLEKKFRLHRKVHESSSCLRGLCTGCSWICRTKVLAYASYF
jgi:hypothetical protein